MRNRFAALSLVVLSATLAFADAPPIFDKNGYADAKAQSIKDGKLLIIDFTAVWCAPCKQMDKDTWSHGRVMQWIRDNAIAVQVDVDEQKDIAQRYKVRAMPTVIVVKNGEEFDRTTGYQGPGQLVDWLEAVKAGEGAAQLQRELAEEQGISGRELVEHKLRDARGALESGQYEEATEAYAWLWEDSLKYDPGMSGVRGSYIAGEIGDLVEAHPPARAPFEAFRDEAKQKADARGDMEALDDWVALSLAMGNGDDVLSWYDAAKDSPQGRLAIMRMSFRIERLLAER